jgi:acyl dehydratase
MLPKEVTKFIGMEEDLGIYEVTIEGIRRYANGADDFNPLYWDEKAAKKSKYGTVVAPLGYLGWQIVPVGAHIINPNATNGVEEALAQAGYPRFGAARTEYEYFRPVKAGDVLHATLKVVDVSEKKRHTSGTLIFTTKDTIYTDKKGKMVAKVRQIGFCR